MVSLEFLKPIIDRLPSIENPERSPILSDKLIWTSVALFIFFAMYNIMAVGIKPISAEASDFLAVVTASKIGSLLSIGIGPIIMASIFLQLLNGAKVIDIDMSDKKQKELFHGTQKILAIILCFLHSFLFVFGYGANYIMGSEDAGASSLFTSILPAQESFLFTQLLVLFQIAFSSIFLMLLDELISKHGIGSGISLFIAANVSFSIVGGTFDLLISEGGVFDTLATGSATAFGIALIRISPLFFTLLVFLVTVYVEGMKVNINIASSRYRMDGKPFSLKLLYVSNIPVILASTLYMNINLLLGSLKGILGTNPIIAVYSENYLVGGLLYLFMPIGHFRGDALTHFSRFLQPVAGLSEFGILEIHHGIIYVITLTIMSIFFGFLWVEASGMGHQQVAEQLSKQDVVIRGFRRDKRVFEKILKRHIGPLTFLGSATVGFLAGIADLTGALGTGTGILLTVGILYRFYEDLEKHNFFEIFPSLRNFGK